MTLNSNLRDKNPQLYDKYFEAFTSLNDRTSDYFFKTSINAMEIIELEGQKFLIAQSHKQNSQYQSQEGVHMPGYPERFEYAYKPTHFSRSSTVIAPLDEKGLLTGKSIIIDAKSHEGKTPRLARWEPVAPRTFIDINLYTKGHSDEHAEALYDGFFDVADRKQILNLLQKRAKEEDKNFAQLKNAIKKFIIPNATDNIYAQVETERQNRKMQEENSKKQAEKFAKKRERLNDPVVSTLRRLSSKIKNQKVRKTVNTLSNNLTEGRALAAGVITSAALTVALGGFQNEEMENLDELRLHKKEVRAKESTITKSGIQGPENIIDHIKVAVSRNYLEKNHLLHHHNNGGGFVIYPDELVSHLQKDNVFAALEKQKQGSFGAIYTPEEREGTVEKIEEFAKIMPPSSFKPTPLFQMLADKAQLVLTITHNGVVQADLLDMQHQSVAYASSNKEKIEKMRQNQEDKPVLIEFATEKNPDNIHYENARVNNETFQLVSKADERTAPANVFMDALRAQKGNSGNKQA